MTTLFTRTIDECEVVRMVVESLPVRTATATLTARTVTESHVVRTTDQRIEGFSQTEIIYVAP